MDIIIIITAFALDLIIGDPRWFPHPAKIIGKAIEKLEKLLRKIKYEKFAGSLLALIIIIGTYLIIYGILKFAFETNKFLGYLLTAVFIYTSLSIKDMAKESMLVYNDLKNNDIEKSRKDLSMIVGRDTNNLDESEIIRATVETIAESTVDGIISPLFYTFIGILLLGPIGGATLALTYKAINTLDSMVGYRNEKYIKFGYLSAKIDDLVNFVPSRLAAFFLALGSAVCGKNGKKALLFAFKNGVKDMNRNSEVPESAIAGALSLRLGGTNYYHGIASVKPYLDDTSCRISGTLEDINQTINIMYVSSYTALVSGIIFYLLLY